MSQQASAPRPDSHHRTSSDAKPPPFSPRNVAGSDSVPASVPASVSATNDRLSPAASQNGEPQRVLYRDEQQGIRPAERGHITNTGSNYSAPDDHKYNTARNSAPNSTANSPKGTAGVVGNSAHPGPITSTMAQDREGGHPDSRPPSAMAATATAAPGAGTDDRTTQPASSRTLGVHNILNPSEAQAVAHHSPVTGPRTSSRGNAGMDTGESRTLPRTRPSSASSPQIGSASSASSTHHGRAQQGHAPPPPGFPMGSGNNAGRPHGPPSFAPVNYGPGPGPGPGYGQQVSAEPGQAPNTTRSPGMGFVPLSGGPGSDQESSPRLGHSHTTPSFGSQPRRILTPRSPRRSSLGRGMPSMGAPGSQNPLFSRRTETPPVPPIPPPNRLHQSMSAPNMGPGSGPGSGPTPGPGSGSGLGQMAGSVPGSYFPPHAGGGPPPSMMTGESPQRSYAQPYYPNEGSGQQGGWHGAGGPGENRGPPGQPHEQHQQQQQQQQQQQEGQQPPRFPFPPGQRQGSFATANPPNRTVSASNAPSGSSENPWAGHGAGVGGPNAGMGGGRSVSISEGQQYITITPSNGEEIRVPVDVHQASKQADEKRLRNAGASARFRARKKEKDREAQMGIQRLEAMNRDLQKRNQELEAQRDFYRNERNRLRHIMSQSPTMREYVESGPPSPASTSLSGRSYVAEGSPMTGGGSQHPPPGAQHPQAPQQQQPPPQPHQMSQQPPQHHVRPHMQHHPQHPQHSQAPLYPPMSMAPEYSGPPPAHLSSGPETSGAGMERPAQRRRTDSGPNIEYYTPSYTTSAPPPPMMPSSLPPPLPPTGSSRFHSMSPSPLSGSPSNPRLPPLRLDTPGSNPSSVGVGGGMGTGPPTPELAHGGVSTLPAPQQYPPATTTGAYSRSYDTAGWAADAPPQHSQHPPPDSKYQR